MAKININSTSISSFMRNPAGPVAQHMNKLGNRVLQRATLLASRRSGRLAASGRIRLQHEATGPVSHVVFEAPHAMAAEEGARPHIIRPRNRAALHFQWERRGIETIVPRGGGFRTHINRGGILIIGKGHVNHPGTRATHFLTRALEDTIRGGGI